MAGHGIGGIDVTATNDGDGRFRPGQRFGTAVSTHAGWQLEIGEAEAAQLNAIRANLNAALALSVTGTVHYDTGPGGRSLYVPPEVPETFHARLLSNMSPYEWIEVAENTDGVWAAVEGGRSSEEDGWAIEYNVEAGLEGEVVLMQRWPDGEHRFQYTRQSGTRGTCLYKYTVTVFGCDSVPLEGATVTVRLDSSHPDFQEPVAVGTTNANGVAVLEGLEPGVRYILQADASPHYISSGIYFTSRCFDLTHTFWPPPCTICVRRWPETLTLQTPYGPVALGRSNFIWPPVPSGGWSGSITVPATVVKASKKKCLSPVFMGGLVDCCEPDQTVIHSSPQGSAIDCAYVQTAPGNVVLTFDLYCNGHLSGNRISLRVHWNVLWPCGLPVSTDDCANWEFLCVDSHNPPWCVGNGWEIDWIDCPDCVEPDLEFALDFSGLGAGHGPALARVHA